MESPPPAPPPQLPDAPGVVSSLPPPPAPPPAFAPPPASPPSTWSRWWPRLIIAAAVICSVGAVVIGARSVIADLQPDHPRNWDPRVVDLVAFVERSRGLTFEHPVQVDFVTEADLDQEVTVADDTITPEQQAGYDQAAAFVRMLGLADGEIDYFQSTNELNQGAIAAFYSPAQKRIVIPDGPMDPVLRSTVVHELVHALQDQHFDIGRSFKRPDQITAYRSLVEGDASLVESAYVRQMSPADQDEYYADAENASAEANDAVSDVPPILTAWFAAPYQLGPPMVQGYLAAQGNERVDQALAAGFLSEEAYFDPYGYLLADEVEFADIDVDTEVAAEHEVVDSGRLGPLSLFLMLASVLPADQALDASFGWSGDDYVIWLDDATYCGLFVFQGDEPRDESEMAEALTRWAEAVPDADRSVELDGDRVTVRVCDPGPGLDLRVVDDLVALTEIPTAVSWEVALAREAGESPKAAQCAAVAFFAEGTVEQFWADPPTTETVALRAAARERCAAD